MSSFSTDLKDVLNTSLGLLGEDEVTDYDSPDTEAGIKMRRFVDFSIREVQRDYLWVELGTKSTLTPTSGGEDYEYDLPSDCLRPLAIRYPSGSIQGHPYFNDLKPTYYLEGSSLFTTAESPELFYIRHEDDPTLWSSELENCIILKLAINSGYLITDNASLIQMYEQKFEALNLPKAKQLQSRKKTNTIKYIPDGFVNIQTRMS